MDLSAASLVEHAPAKINLALHVTGRRRDGFHTIESLVVFTRRGDRVTVVGAADDRFEVEGPFASGVPHGPDNLVIKARDMIRAFAKRHLDPTWSMNLSASRQMMPGGGPALTQDTMNWLRSQVSRTQPKKVIAGPAAIHLTKNLPVASGIGGGSSDAAATLYALNRFWEANFVLGRLIKLGQPLGADVPMCLHRGPLVARGIGEQVEPIPDFPALHMVLVNPGVAVSTPDVFRALMSRENPGLPPLPSLHRSSFKDEGQLAFADICRWLAATRNDLQAPAISLTPIISETIEALISTGAAFARMSGSGATCFGLFETASEAAHAAAEIRQRRPGWWVVATESIPSKDSTDAPA